MGGHIEIKSGASLEDIFQARKKAKTDMEIAQTALLGVLQAHKDSQQPVRVVGFPSRVAVVDYDEEGSVGRRVSVHVGPLVPKPGVSREPRTIESGFIADVRRELLNPIVSVQPEEADNWWQFSLDSIVEISAIKPDSRLRTQRAIINSETFWGIRSGDPSQQFNFEP